MESIARTSIETQKSGRTGAALKRFLHLVARLSFVVLLLSIGVGVVAGVGSRLHLWDLRVGLLTIFPYCVYLGIAGFASALVWLLTAIFSNSAAGARYGLIGLVGSMAVLWMPLRDLYLVNIEQSIPPIYDITTDTEHAPAFVALDHHQPGAAASSAYDGLKQVRFDGKNYTQEMLQKLYYADIKAASQLGTTPSKLFNRALADARAMGWTIVAVRPEAGGGIIEATDQTLLFGLTDDIVIRVKPAGIGARLDIRSRSRVAISDFGRNAARIGAYLKKLAAG